MKTSHAFRAAWTAVLIGAVAGCSDGNGPSEPLPQEARFDRVEAFGELGDGPFDLVADGGDPATAETVGQLTVTDDGSSLTIRYDLTAAGWCMTQAHVAVEGSLEAIPQTRKDNPLPGQFEYGDAWEFDVCQTSYTVIVPLPGSPTVYVAAHAVVQTIVGYEADLGAFAANLPDGLVNITPAYPGTTFGDPSYFDTTITSGGDLNGVYDGFCIDTGRTINPGRTYDALVYSSYETLPDGLVDYPENLDLVNYMINQGWPGQTSPSGGTYTFGDLQRAIWTVIDDTNSTAGLGSWSQARVDEILADALAFGEGFEPGCDDLVAVVLNPVDSSGATTNQVTIAQVTFASVPNACTPVIRSETAWALEHAFAGKNWAQYITYTPSL